MTHQLCTAVRDDVRTVPIEEWGKNHWSALAYAETRWVDHGGKIKNEHMRCNERRHRKLHNTAGSVLHGSRRWDEKYSTRLRDGQEPGHDDWDCLEDLAEAGLLAFDFVDRREGWPCEGGEVVVSLTKLGADIAGRLRSHRGRGGSYADFAVESSDG